MHSNRAARLLALLLAFGLMVSLPVFAQGVQRGSFVRQEVKHDVSLPLRDMARSAGAVMPGTARTLIPGKRPNQFSNASNQPDALAQHEILPDVGTTNLLNFDGLGGTESGSVEPPDTNGAAGTTQFVETANLSYAVYDKATGSKLLGPVRLNVIWSGFGGLCQTVAGGDPVVLWDRAAQRWLVTELAYNGSFSSNFLCMAVSTSADATGSYNRYAFSFGTSLPDYPKYAIWPDAYYVSVNIFANSGSNFAGAEPCAFDRNAMLSGGTATMVCFTPKITNFGFLPSDWDGATAPPSGAPNHYMELFSSTRLEQFDFHVDFVNTNNSTFTGPTVITVTSWIAACGGGACVPQPSPGEPLDTLGDRLMHRAGYRNFGDHETITLSHSVKPGTGTTAVSALRWYELRATPVGGTFSVFQSGTFQHPKVTLWMPGIAMDKVGDIAIGSSASSTTVKPSTIYTGRTPTDPTGKLESPFVVVGGTGVQTAGGSRWGDYSSMSIDPTDDCTFWFSGEYYKTTSAANWATRINSFKFPGCH